MSFTFTEIVKDDSVKFYIGWYYISLVILIFVLNALNTIYQMGQEIWHKKWLVK